MKVVYANKEKILLPENACVIMGNFDGVHLGHQQLIKETKNKFKISAVLTFNPHPQEVIRSNEFKTIVTLEKKLQIFKEFQLDYVLLFDFNDNLMKMSKDNFIDKLKEFNIKNIICGKDYRFGTNASGDVSDLEKFFNVFVVNDYKVDNTRISSTYIKKILKEDILLANKYLGRPYSIYSKVISGNKIGRTLGFPTANIDAKNYILPKQGVYLCEVLINNKKHQAITNIGHNPTLNFSNDPKVEIHIIDFDANIYNEYIELYFLDYIREEKRFDNKEELLKQIQHDLNYAKAYKNLLEKTCIKD